ncbi:MAG: tetratricopeptide repeat protein [Bacteroidetes bacterium]|nr:tetratricopeptide repeat protein [Bacteroidota bacterium]
MKKAILALLLGAFFSSATIAQSVADGIKYLYYQRNKSAVETLEKVYASKSKDVQAIYWLGQAYLAEYGLSGNKSDLEKAKALYQKALSDGMNDPYIWIGMGHVEILEGKNAEARQRFEAAITNTKGKKGAENPDILKAIGRAESDGSSQIGDPQYGIDVLTRAKALDLTNPDIDMYLGLCYLKLSSDKGGEAVEAFRDATVRDPNYAAAYWRIGRVYRSQNNLPSMNEWFGKAIAADAKFAPVYHDYFEYYQERDINAAKEFLDKYVANADKDCNTEFFVGDYLFRAGKYQESLAKADEMSSGECKDYPRLPLLYAYDYNRLGDSTKALNYLQKFLGTMPSSQLKPTDYVFAGNMFKSISGYEDSAVAYLSKAVDMDTVVKNKLAYIDTISTLYKKLNNPAERLVWLKKSFSLNQNPSNRDIYDMGDAALAAGDYTLANSMFEKYKEKYPNEIYGYKGMVDVAQKMDSTGAAAVIPMNNLINDFLLKDTTKYGTTIAYYHALLGTYYVNEKKDYDSSIIEFQKALQFDPANPQYKQYLDILIKARDKRKNSSNNSGNSKSPADKSKTKK